MSWVIFGGYHKGQSDFREEQEAIYETLDS